MACSQSLGPSVEAEGQSVLPTETLQDLVTYGDAAVVLKVTSEKELPLSPEEDQRGEGIVTRSITTTQTTGFQLHGSPNKPPVTLSLTNGGWAVRGTDRQPWRIAGEQSMTLNQEYLVIFSRVDFGSEDSPTPEWIVLDAPAVPRRKT